ncbi:MAG TPA: DPP IV N-terminal domain-containing protein [Vicinamibacterales bacterium]|jgi:dipeptidyl-peptidase-4
MKYAGRIALAVTAVVMTLQVRPGAQDRLKGMPGYEQFQKTSAATRGLGASLGSPTITWTDDSSTFEFTRDGKLYRFDIATRQASLVGDAPAMPGRGRAAAPGGGQGRGNGQTQPERGRQFDSAESPDGKLTAVYKNRNISISDADGGNVSAVTTDGNEKDRTKYGTASWVYGEELDQRTAMWWSPDSRKLAYYRFDEKQVIDYYLQMTQTQIQDSLDVEAYPKPGKPNPIVDLYVYDVATRHATRIDVRDGKPFDAAAVGHYVYDVEWAPDGTELLINRTNRQQNVLDFAACSPATGSCRTIVRDESKTGWVENSPQRKFLSDGKRFVWESERTGWKNLYLYDLTGRLLVPLTTATTYETANIVRIDEAKNRLFYTARDGDNFMKLQLHSVGLDGRDDRRLTDPAFNHTVTMSPDGKYFVDVAQTHDTPPVTRLLDSDGHAVADVATTDLTKFKAAGLKPVEMFTYESADGKTTLHGLIHFPSTFDPAKKYPALASVYGGPASPATSERFTMPNALTEYGFIVLTLDSRAVPGMGKRTLDELYLKLGQVEIDDMAAGVKALWGRPYFDKNRVGIFGTSYGGYSSVMAILRYPDVFAVASASSPPTDWRNYDTIYTERYMWMPEANKDGYDAGSAMQYADKLKGRLLLYYGTSDNNVHPSNSLQLIKALQAAGKSFDVQVGPDQGHSGVNQQRMMEFFIDNLVTRPALAATDQ